MRELKLIIGVPSTGKWEADFGLSLVQLFADATRKFEGWDNQQMMVLHKRGSILPQMRQQMLEQAIARKATHVLFLDSDQRFPHWTLRRLVHWGKPVVAANVPTKQIPSNPSARQFDPHQRGGRKVYTRAGMDGLEQVWRVGTGIMLVELAAVKDLPKPWFPVLWKEEIGDFQGEDWGFCEVLEKAGIPIYVDHKLSWEVEHLGVFRYAHDHVQEDERLVLTADEARGTHLTGSVVQ